MPYFARSQVIEVEVRVDGVGVVRTVPVHVPEGGFGVVVVTVPR